MRRQKQAEGLVDFMLGDLNDRLAQVDRLDIMQDVDDKAMKYFQSLPNTDVTLEALAQRAKTMEKSVPYAWTGGSLPLHSSRFAPPPTSLRDWQLPRREIPLGSWLTQIP